MNLLPVASLFTDIPEAIVVFFHDLGLGWGPSIVALTFAVRLAILPLSLKQIKSMRAMQALQPQLKAIQEKHKNDKQRQQQEMMRFYQENSFNPLGACLPLVLQIPFFITLFYLLRSDAFRTDIRGEESFGFIPNLAEPLTAYPLVLVTMLVIYVATQLGATLVSMATAERNQRLLMLGLPFVFVFFIINFEAGLMVYWITTNVWTIGQQVLVKKFLPPPDPQTAPAKATANGDSAERAPRKARGARTAANGSEASGRRAAGANGSGNGAAAKPPPGAPRKKKKRSGRRR